MTYGLVIRSSTGSTQIDGELPVYGGVETLTFRCTKPVANIPGLYSADLFGYDPDSIIAISKPPNGVWVTTQDAYLYQGNSIKGVVYSTSTTHTFNAVRFRAMSSFPQSSESYGIRAWSSGGRLIFDSGHKLFSIEQKMIVTSDGDKYYSGGHTTHFLLPGLGQQRGYVFSGNGDQTYYCSFMTTYSGRIVISSRPYYRTVGNDGGSSSLDLGVSAHVYRINVA